MEKEKNEAELSRSLIERESLAEKAEGEKALLRKAPEKSFRVLILGHDLVKLFKSAVIFKSLFRFFTASENCFRNIRTNACARTTYLI